MQADVTVIGASASGLLAGLLLARQGMDVKIYERSSHLNPLPRTLITTNLYRDYLEGLGKSAIVNEIKAFELFADGRAATVELQRPDLIVERAALIRELAKETHGAGGEVTLGTRFVGLRPSGQGVFVELMEQGREGSHEVETGAVIGADGACSNVALAAGWQRQPTVSVIQAIVRRPPDLAPDTARVWFKSQETPYFYWLIPESTDRAALGLISQHPAQGRGLLDAFLADQNLTAFEYQAARIPLYTGWRGVHRKVGNGSVYLVGDAAAQVKVSTVGGLVTGMRGARAVADAIASGDGHAQLRALRKELDAHLWIRRSLHGFGEREHSLLLDLLDDRVMGHLGSCTRDEAVKLLLKVIMARPRLALMGLWGLIAGRRLQP